LFGFIVLKIDLKSCHSRSESVQDKRESTLEMSDGNLGHDENSGNQPLFRAVAGIMKSEPGIKTGDCYGE
jgi:hypothetical protein